MFKVLTSSVDASALSRSSRCFTSTPQLLSRRTAYGRTNSGKASGSSRHRLETPHKVASPKSHGSRTRSPPIPQKSLRQAVPGKPHFAARPSRFVGNPNAPTSQISKPSASNVSSRETPPHLKKKVMRTPSSGPQHPGTPKITRRIDGLVSPSSAPANGVTQFRTPPLLPGLLSRLLDSIGEDAKPFPIQSLSIAHFLGSQRQSLGSFPPHQSQTLLASETGSGKSIAYLLPLIQALKSTESSEDASRHSRVGAEPRLRPRAILLAPTHELCRQLTSYAKTLSHDVKLRTVCLSNPPPRSRSTARQFEEFGHQMLPIASPRQVDVVVGTPSKVAQMAALEIETDEESPSAAARLKTPVPKVAEMSLDGVEWVVIDEADVMFDRDFRQLVHGILDGVKAAKLADAAMNNFSMDSTSSLEGTPLHGAFPFNLILTTATIPSSLNTHLLMHFPNLIRLTSPKLHKLPNKLHSELVDIKGLGNPLSAIHKKLLEIFANQYRRAQLPNRIGNDSTTSAGRVILFCNRSAKAEEIGEYLRKMKMSALIMTASSKGRRRGSNRHLESFLRRSSINREAPPLQNLSEGEPRVLVTTSLLARGLDFSPSVSHVLIVDEPRNEVDFLHRAGRTGRAGRPGTVVIFGKGIAPRKAKKPGFA